MRRDSTCIPLLKFVGSSSGVAASASSCSSCSAASCPAWIFAARGLATEAPGWWPSRSRGTVQRHHHLAAGRSPSMRTNGASQALVTMQSSCSAVADARCDDSGAARLTDRRLGVGVRLTRHIGAAAAMPAPEQRRRCCHRRNRRTGSNNDDLLHKRPTSAVCRVDSTAIAAVYDLQSPNATAMSVHSSRRLECHRGTQIY